LSTLLGFEKSFPHVFHHARQEDHCALASHKPGTHASSGGPTNSEEASGRIHVMSTSSVKTSESAPLLFPILRHRTDLQKKHLESAGVSISRSADDGNHATTFLRCSLHQRLQCKFHSLNRLQPKGRQHHVLIPKASSNITATIEGCNSPWTRHGCWLHGCRPIHSPSELACFQMSSGEAEVRFDDEISPRENGANAAVRNTRPLSPATTRTYTCAPHLWRYH
jgi:hypothetical protein